VQLAAVSTDTAAIYEEVAAAARTAFQGRRKGDTRFEPEVEPPAPRAFGDEEAMRAFIGPNWRAYRRLWNRDRLNPRLRSSFGLGPALLGATWLIYRKRYLPGFLLVAAEMATAYFAPWFTLVAALLARGFVGRFGKSLVMKAGAAAVERELRGAGATDSRLGRLRKAGGVNLWLPILLMLGEAWLAVHRLEGPHTLGLDPAGLLANVQRALP
jgi:hypothetical protein